MHHPRGAVARAHSHSRSQRICHCRRRAEARHLPAASPAASARARWGLSSRPGGQLLGWLGPTAASVGAIARAAASGGTYSARFEAAEERAHGGSSQRRAHRTVGGGRGGCRSSGAGHMRRGLRPLQRRADAGEEGPGDVVNVRRAAWGREQGSEGARERGSSGEVVGCSTGTAQFAAQHTRDDTAGGLESTRERRGLGGARDGLLFLVHVNLGGARDGLLFLVHVNSESLVSPTTARPTPLCHASTLQPVVKVNRDRQCHCVTSYNGCRASKTGPARRARVPDPRCLWPTGAQALHAGADALLGRVLA